MNDFEVHPRGTSAELKASRSLANEIEHVITQYGNVIPENVLRSYYELRHIYAKQMEGHYE